MVARVTLMRLAVILEQALAPVPGGTGRYSVELAAALVATASPGAQISSWVAAHRRVAAAAIPGVDGPHQLFLPRQLLARAWQHGLGPAPRDCDLIHAPTPLLPPVRQRRPVVVTVHDAVPWTHPETMTAHGVRWHRSMIARAARLAAAVTVPTAAVAAQLQQWVPSLPPERIHVLGAGVSPALLAASRGPDIEQRADRLGLPDRFVLTLATLEPRKGLDVLLAALAGIGAERPVLVSVGSPGWGGVAPLAAAATAGLRPTDIRVLGRLDDADLAAVMIRAQALVVPSRAEGFGLPVVEAMALGVPVIISDVPALVEVAGGAAEMVPTGDAEALTSALVHVLGDDRRRQELIELGHDRAGEHSWEAVARRAWALYQRLLG